MKFLRNVMVLFYFTLLAIMFFVIDVFNKYSNYFLITASLFILVAMLYSDSLKLLFVPGAMYSKRIKHISIGYKISILLSAIIPVLFVFIDKNVIFDWTEMIYCLFSTALSFCLITGALNANLSGNDGVLSEKL